MSVTAWPRIAVPCPSCDDVDMVPHNGKTVCPSCGYGEPAQVMAYSSRTAVRERFFPACEHASTCTVCGKNLCTEHDTDFSTCVDTGIHHLDCMSSCTACRLCALEEGPR